jgi:hypothetical protein
MCSAALAALALACDGPGVVSPHRVTIAQEGGVPASQALVGTWRRIVYFIDGDGVARSSETTWQFTSGGGASRVQVARNYTDGISDVLVSAGQFRVEGTRIVVDLTTPSVTRLVYEVRRSGNQLELAGEPYLLVGG